MIYKFDILFNEIDSFDKPARYLFSDILGLPNVEIKTSFGEGYLSQVNTSGDCGMSVQSLYQKYRTLLVGRKVADLCGNEFTPVFSLAGEELLSVGIPTVEGGMFPIPLKYMHIASKVFNNFESDSVFQVIIPITGSITIEDNIGSVLGLSPGELAMISAATNCFSIDSDNADILISCYDD